MSGLTQTSEGARGVRQHFKTDEIKVLLHIRLGIDVKQCISCRSAACRRHHDVAKNRRTILCFGQCIRIVRMKIVCEQIYNAANRILMVNVF